jgi:hypothetical protein
MKSSLLFLIFHVLSLCFARIINSTPSPSSSSQPAFKTSPGPTTITTTTSSLAPSTEGFLNPTQGPTAASSLKPSITLEPSLFDDDQNNTDSGNGSSSPNTIVSFPFYVNLAIILCGLALCISLGFIISFIQSRRQLNSEKYDFGAIHKNLLADGKDVTRYK